MTKIPQIPQLPPDLWQQVLRILEWSVKIPLALLAVFAACCLAVIGFLIVYRITVAIVTLLT